MKLGIVLSYYYDRNSKFELDNLIPGMAEAYRCSVEPLKHMCPSTFGYVAT
jgi:hypothetical protein